jgi:hypothetical protein
LNGLEKVLMLTEDKVRMIRGQNHVREETPGGWLSRGDATSLD